MPDDKTDRLLNEIGQLLAEDSDYPLNGTLLYAELDRSFVAPSIFKDLGDHVPGDGGANAAAGGAAAGVLYQDREGEGARLDLVVAAGNSDDAAAVER